jgi:nicotinamidase-related amidase
MSNCPMYCPRSNIIIENLCRIKHEYTKILFMNDAHKENDPEFQYIPSHLLIGTIEQKLLADCYFKNARVIEKNTPCGFENRSGINIKPLLVGEVHLAGFLTSWDVLGTAMDLIKMQVDFSVLEPLCADITEERHDRAIRLLRENGVKTSGVFSQPSFK